MKKFESVVEIGRGGFGVVDKVKDEKGNLRARKTFSPASYIPPGAHDQLRKRFKREVTIQAELGGREIMPVLESDLDGPEPWFIMPLAEKSYEQQIATDRTAGSVDIDAIADILNALEYLHDLGYVHRDLNPKNILFVDGHWKLSDFGAVLPPSGHTVTLTEETVIYTEQYCAPEQRNSFHKAQASADVYSFGCILHDIFGKGTTTTTAIAVGLMFDYLVIAYEIVNQIGAHLCNSCLSQSGIVNRKLTINEPVLYIWSVNQPALTTGKQS